MTERHHLAHCRIAALTHTGRLSALVFLLALGLAGCRHKVAAYQLPLVVHAPVDLEPISSTGPPSLIAELPPPELAPLPPPPPPPPPPKRRASSAPKEETQPTQIAEGAPAALAIGILSTGDDQTPQSQQQAKDMIASLSRRIAALPQKTAAAQKKQINQIRHFLDQAQQALNSGDAKGANNLATKAWLLMDDLEKK